jgi:hypothetical protein
MAQQCEPRRTTHATIGPVIGCQNPPIDVVVDLHAERGRNAFQLPRRFSTHPADAPRMTVMLDALTVLNQGKSAAEVETKWKKLLSIAGQSEPSDFQRYYPKHVLRECVEQAFEGFAAMGCKPWPGNDTDAIKRTLNEAWQRFWTAPQSFAAWEKEVTEALISSAMS